MFTYDTVKIDVYFLTPFPIYRQLLKKKFKTQQQLIQTISINNTKLKYGFKEMEIKATCKVLPTEKLRRLHEIKSFSMYHYRIFFCKPNKELLFILQANVLFFFFFLQKLNTGLSMSFNLLFFFCEDSSKNVSI